MEQNAPVLFSQPRKQTESIVSGVSCNLNLQFQSHWSEFDRVWQKRPTELDYR